MGSEAINWKALGVDAVEDLNGLDHFDVLLGYDSPPIAQPFRIGDKVYQFFRAMSGQTASIRVGTVQDIANEAKIVDGLHIDKGRILVHFPPLAPEDPKGWGLWDYPQAFDPVGVVRPGSHVYDTKNAEAGEGIVLDMYPSLLGDMCHVNFKHTREHTFPADRLVVKGIRVVAPPPAKAKKHGIFKRLFGGTSRGATTNYVLGCDVIGATPDPIGSDRVIVVRPKDVASVVRAQKGAPGDIALSLLPETTASAFYEQFAGQLKDNLRLKGVDADVYVAATAPPPGAPMKSDLLGGVAIGSVGTAAAYGIFQLAKHLMRRH